MLCNVIWVIRLAGDIWLSAIDVHLVFASIVLRWQSLSQRSLVCCLVEDDSLKQAILNRLKAL
jgi:hypothetical protein